MVQTNSNIILLNDGLYKYEVPLKPPSDEKKIIEFGYWLIYDKDDLEGEIWKNISGFEGYYQVSNFTRVKSLDRDIVRNDRDTKVSISGHILPQRISKRGYWIVSLSKYRKVYTKCPHKLYMDTFIENPENKRTVNHIDGNKLNNIPSNFEWGTHKENNDHAKAMGLNPQIGESHFFAKLKESEVIEIFNSPLYHSQIAEKYCINPSIVSRIKGRKIWTHITKKLPDTNG